MNPSVERGRRFGSLTVMAIIVLFVVIATARAIHTLAPPEFATASPQLSRLAIQAQAYRLDSTVAPGFVDQIIAPSLGQIPLPASHRVELSDVGDITIIGWDFFTGPPHVKLASVTYATIDGNFIAAAASQTRADVGAAYHDARLAQSGFAIPVRVKTLTKGTHVLRLYACDTETKERRIFAAPITFVTP
jgi:hypothetical protein